MVSGAQEGEGRVLDKEMGREPADQQPMVLPP